MIFDLLKINFIRAEISTHKNYRLITKNTKNYRTKISNANTPKVKRNLVKKLLADPWPSLQEGLITKRGNVALFTNCLLI